MMAPIPREVLEKIREAIENEEPLERNRPIYLKYIWATSLEEAIHGTEMYGYFPRWPCGGHAVEERALEDSWAMEDDSYHLFVIPCKDKEEFDHLCWRDRVSQV